MNDSRLSQIALLLHFNYIYQAPIGLFSIAYYHFVVLFSWGNYLLFVY